MSTPSKHLIISEETRLILDEIQALRKEVAALREESHGVVLDIRDMVAEIHAREKVEKAVEAGLAQVEESLEQAMGESQPSMITCEACGSDVERHEAESGFLLICKACGHTAFANRRVTPDRRLLADRRKQGQSIGEEMPEIEPAAPPDWTQH
jgi:DNA-directed RNA polymerase subunit M/transcription elongation factor TFIIS